LRKVAKWNRLVRQNRNPGIAGIGAVRICLTRSLLSLCLMVTTLEGMLRADVMAEPAPSANNPAISSTPAEFEARMASILRSGRWIGFFSGLETDTPERKHAMNEICITPEIQAGLTSKRVTPIKWMVSRKECALDRLQFDDPAHGAGQFHMSGQCHFPGTDFRIVMDGAFGDGSFSMISQTTTQESGKATDEVLEHMSMVRQGDCTPRATSRTTP